MNDHKDGKRDSLRATMPPFNSVYNRPADGAIFDDGELFDVPATTTEWKHDFSGTLDSEGSERSTIIDTPPPSVEGKHAPQKDVHLQTDSQR